MCVKRLRQPGVALLSAMTLATAGCPPTSQRPSEVVVVNGPFSSSGFERVVPSCEGKPTEIFSADGFASITVLCSPQGETGALFHLQRMNEAGEFVTGSEGIFFPGPNVLVTDGDVIDLGDRVETGINGSGLVCGYTFSYAGPTRAIVWENGVEIELGALPGGDTSRALAINDAGVIVGTAADTPTIPYPLTIPPLMYPVTWERIDDRWRISRLDGVPGGGLLGGRISEAVAVNNGGQIVLRGYISDAFVGSRDRVFLWEKGTLIDIGGLGGSEMEARDINEDGAIVGWSTLSDLDAVLLDAMPARHAFVWREGVLTDLGTLGGQNSEAFAIDNRGRVVGLADTAEFIPPDCAACSATPIRRSFLWQDGLMMPLQDLVPADVANRILVADITEEGRILASVTLVETDEDAVVMLTLPD